MFKMHLFLFHQARFPFSTIAQSANQVMPLSGDPLLASLANAAEEGSDSTETVPHISTARMTIQTSPAITIRNNDDSRTPRKTQSGRKSEGEHFLTIDESGTDSLEANIPSFSYSYQSPVSSPPVDRVYTESLPSSSGLATALNTSLFLGSSTSSHAVSAASAVSVSSDSTTCEYGTLLSSGVFPRQTSASDDEGRLARSKSAWNTSFLESGGLVLPPAIGHFPRPQKGQTLTAFLTSLSDNLPDLDRENAHFNVSEALISAFERVKIKKFQRSDVAQFEERQSDDDTFGTVNTDMKSRTGAPLHHQTSCNNARALKKQKQRCTTRSKDGQSSVGNKLSETEESE